MSDTPLNSKQDEKKSPYSMYAISPLCAGTTAPDFSLHTTPDKTVSIREFRGLPTILASYPADWSHVCGDEITLFNEVLPEFIICVSEYLSRCC